MRAKSNEYAPNAEDVNTEIREIKERNEDDWIAPKYMQIGCFYKKHNNEEKRKESRNSNMHEELKENDDDEKHENKK